MDRRLTVRRLMDHRLTVRRLTVHRLKDGRYSRIIDAQVLAYTRAGLKFDLPVDRDNSLHSPPRGLQMEPFDSPNDSLSNGTSFMRQLRQKPIFPIFPNF